MCIDIYIYIYIHIYIHRKRERERYIEREISNISIYCSQIDIQLR